MQRESLHVRCRIDIKGVNPFVLVGPRQAAQLKRDWHKPMPVRFKINGMPDEPWRTNLMPRGDGSFYLYLAGFIREASGTAVGDLIRVSVEFDDRYRGGPTHPMPRWFAVRLQGNAPARAAWRRLPPSRQKEILRYFAGLKSSEARMRNADRAVRVLAGAKERFMARDWNV